MQVVLEPACKCLRSQGVRNALHVESRDAMHITQAGQGRLMRSQREQTSFACVPLDMRGVASTTCAGVHVASVMCEQSPSKYLSSVTSRAASATTQQAES